MNALQLTPDDDVSIVLKALNLGDTVGLYDVIACELVPSGHKISLRAIKQGEDVKKYGWSIGIATQDIG
jgi:hypothetical protein